LNFPKSTAIGLALALAIVTPATATPAAFPPGPFTITGTAQCDPGDPTRSLSPAETVDWKAVPGATSYEVWRNGALFTTIQARSSSSFELTARVSNGSTGTHYFVVARNSVGTSTSNTIEITVSADICITAPPVAVLSGEVKCDPQTHHPVVSLSWSIVPGVDGWKLYRDGSVYAVPQGWVFVDTNVLPGHMYTYNIATNGLSAPLSNPITVAVSNAICLPDPVSVTPTLFCNISGPAVRLNWSPSANAVTYSVLRGATTLVSGLKDPVYTDSATDAGVTYAYQVIASNDIGSTPSPSVTVTVGDEICPPSSFTASALATCSNATPSVLLTWLASAHAASYVVSRDGLAVSGTLSATTREFVDAPAIGFHSYSIRATNASGFQNANASISLSGTVCSSAPGAFTLMATTACNPPVTLTWTKPLNDVLSYTIFRNQAPLTTVGTTTSMFADDDTLPDGSYTYFVRATGAGGASDSNIVTANVDRASCEVPDLVALGIQPSAMIGHAGDTVAVSVELANVGNATAMATTGRVRFGRGPSMSSTDPVLGTIALPAMGVGADIQRTINLKLPAAAAGTYFLFISLDEEHVSGEAHFNDDVMASGAFSLTDMIPPRRRAATH
jgi:hypothetical protein